MSVFSTRCTVWNFYKNGKNVRGRYPQHVGRRHQVVMETTVKCQRAEQNRILPCKIPQRGSTSSPAVPCSSCQLHGCTWGKKMKVHIHVTKNWLTWFMFNDTDTKTKCRLYFYIYFLESNLGYYQTTTLVQWLSFFNHRNISWWSKQGRRLCTDI